MTIASAQTRHVSRASGSIWSGPKISLREKWRFSLLRSHALQTSTRGRSKMFPVHFWGVLRLSILILTFPLKIMDTYFSRHQVGCQILHRLSNRTKLNKLVSACHWKSIEHIGLWALQPLQGCTWASFTILCAKDLCRTMDSFFFFCLFFWQHSIIYNPSNLAIWISLLDFVKHLQSMFQTKINH